MTVFFWIVKLLTTAMGEATSDYLVNRFNPYLAVFMGFVAFALAISLQFAVRKYIAGVYWLAAAMVAVFGTMVADAMHVGLGIPYIASASLFAATLVVVFILWYKSEGTLSIHSVYTKKRELFYWATVVSTFALGTALGDLSAYTFNLGFFTSGVIFAVVFALPGIIFGLFRRGAVATFWFAYIMTRPLGASFADWSSKPQSLGGLGHGDGPVAGILALLIVLLVGYLTLSGADQQSKHPHQLQEHSR